MKTRSTHTEILKLKLGRTQFWVGNKSLFQRHGAVSCDCRQQDQQSAHAEPARVIFLPKQQNKSIIAARGMLLNNPEHADLEVNAFMFTIKSEQCPQQSVRFLFFIWSLKESRLIQP